MLGLEGDELEDGADLLDGVGELGNMVAGIARASLAATSHGFRLGIPFSFEGRPEAAAALPAPGAVGAMAFGEVGGESLRVGIWKAGESSP